jgi:lipopolysaccharide export system protein LptA
MHLLLVSRALAGSVILAAALVALPAMAEKTDREKPVNVEADRMLVDDAKKESVFEGNVLVTQGTLQLRGDRVIVRQDAEGFSYGIAYGNPATFRQKREGYDEYIDGFADRLEYDGRKDLLQMFAAAKLTKGTDEVRGDYISYNAKTEFFQVLGSGKAASSPTDPNARVRAVITPKPRTLPGQPGAPAETPAGGTSLKPSAELGKPPKP